MSSRLTAASLAQFFNYDPHTGIVTWKWRARSHFPSDRVWTKFNSEFAGQPAGSFHHGYLRVSLTTCGERRSIYVHRIAWGLMTGEWPAETVDHVDGDGVNNKWANLRAATAQQNLRNTPVRSHSGSGVKGVQSLRGGRFVARITVNKRTIHLGTFSDVGSAQAAFAKKALELHGKFAHRSIAEGITR